MPFISVVLFFGHSVVTQLQQNSKNAYRAVSSHHKLQQGRRKIRAQEKRLHREQEENEQLKMQRMRLENLQKQRQEILEKNGITDATLRLSVGIENVKDLLAELESVFASL